MAEEKPRKIVVHLEARKAIKPFPCPWCGERLDGCTMEKKSSEASIVIAVCAFCFNPWLWDGDTPRKPGDGEIPTEVYDAIMITRRHFK